MPNDAAIFDTLGIFERGLRDSMVRVFDDDTHQFGPALYVVSEIEDR